jgi:hypothetical protein
MENIEKLNDRELERQLSLSRRTAKLTKVLAIISAIVMLFSFEFKAWVFAILMGIVAIVSSVLFVKSSNKAKELLSNNVIDGILSEVFNEYEYKAKESFSNELLRESGLGGNWDYASGSHLVIAKYKGYAVKFSNVTLSEEVEHTNDEGNLSSSSKTKFKGPWLVIEFERNFPAKLRLRENFERKGISKKIFGERILNKSDIETENEEFNKRFRIQTEDPNSAYSILTSHFMECIIKTDDTAKTGTDFCFFENRVHIACNTGKYLFELKKKESHNLDVIRTKIRAELAYITSIADVLLENEY